MPLNKLENFIKNTEGRILYVNPNDLDSSDGIENQGNSLTKPFKTLQRALLESARFSYLRGSDNDITEKTTILLFPGEHVIDNRPGFSIRDESGNAVAYTPAGTPIPAQNAFTLTLDSNFDITQPNNILHRFNSREGGVIIPRGTSVVGLDLRKTKIRPKYVPNPTDYFIKNSAIFRITGACYFWQFTIFDGNENGLVYTDPVNFDIANQSKPTFSHHKLTVFEYADGVNVPAGYSLTDLDMYYAKISNAFNRASGRDIDQKFPSESLGFTKQRPEWEIVGAFASDPINIASIISGDGATPGSVVTVNTTVPHLLNSNTPIKIRGVNIDEYNISTKVQNVINDTTFTYLLPFVRDNLPAGPAGGLSGSSATVTIETDTVTGASPYIFNISLRSVFGMQGMHADGSKASGFRSMVVAQFTAVSLQKDDRAFVKYNQQSRLYDGINITKVTGANLSAESSSLNTSTVYHLDPNAIYRENWKSSHIKASNDAVIQIVSVFAIGFTKHFDIQSGGDASITNSNSNFGQFSLVADGFKFQAFEKDNRAYITSIITPRSIVTQEDKIEWVQIDVTKTQTVGKPNHLYLFGYNRQDQLPPFVSQGYRIGARLQDKLYLDTTISGSLVRYEADIYMLDNVLTQVSVTTPPTPHPSASGTSSAEKVFTATVGSNGVITLSSNHNLLNGEKIILISDTGDLPENVDAHEVYHAITQERNSSRASGDGIELSANQIQLASSKTNADASIPVFIRAIGGTQLRVVSRVSDKIAGDLGHPIQWDPNNDSWFIHVKSNNQIYSNIASLNVDSSNRTDITYVRRIEDNRSLDERLYKVRIVIPKELANARDPVEGFIIQESSSTNARNNADFNLTNISSADFTYNRNTRFISTCTYDTINSIITVNTEKPHDLQVNEIITIKNISSTTNIFASNNIGFNGTFRVSEITNTKTFKYTTTDIFGIVHSPGTFTSNSNIRSTALPRFERTDNQNNLYIYRTEVITPYINQVQDGVYHAYVLNASNQVENEFISSKYGQNIVNLYPQLDKDNVNDNPPSAKSYAKKSPLGDVTTNFLKNSITRETIDKFCTTFNCGKKITAVSYTPTSATLTFDREHGLSGIATYTALTGGSGHTDGIYHNVKLYNTSGAPNDANWNGALSAVRVVGGSVVSAQITDGGSAYNPDATPTGTLNLYFDINRIGGTPNANITISNIGISTANENTVQVTGIGTTSGGYYRIIDSVTSKNQISIARTVQDPLPIVGEYAIDLGPSILCSLTSYDPSTGISVITAETPHGLLAGSSFRVLDSNHNNKGDYIVQSIVNQVRFTSRTNINISGSRFLLKHGLSSNESVSDDTGENLGTRGLSFYDKETLQLRETITTESTFSIRLRSSGIGTLSRFPLGSYIQVDSEIMRISSNTLSGVENDKITVIRGVMGTLREEHKTGATIKKIKLIPIELRRPSILRASGHTFEYIGYGPGNYSTALPQVQLRTLTEREDFLVQSQETACGNVIYTGMNNNGDFFNGNTKTISSSGKTISYEIPTPTVTGEDPSRLSVVFDEVTIKERLLVEGGNSGTILSQFDGPVTFNGDVRLNRDISVRANIRTSGTIRSSNSTSSTSCTTGALTVVGGVGIGENLNVCGNVGISGGPTATQSTSTTTGALTVAGGVGIVKRLNVGEATNLASTLDVTGAATFDSSVSLKTNKFLNIGDNNNIRIRYRKESDGNSGFIQFTPDAGVPGDGRLKVLADWIQFAPASESATLANFKTGTADNWGVQLYYNNAERFRTTNSGVTVAGGIEGTSLSVSGAISAGSLSVTTTITAGGDITAFASDMRLKENIKPIENALDKVLSLRGFTYNFNDLGESLGYDPIVSHAGVSAQEVQQVLPEAVVPAPVDANYLSVKYDKLVPLLIEAIKELKQEIEDLKNNK